MTRRPVPGDIAVARAEGVLPSFVLVLARVRGEPATLVALMSEDVDYATHRDVLLERAETGLSFPLMVEADIVAPIWDEQLDTPVARLPSELSGLLQSRPDLAALPGPPRHGIPLAGPADARWKWKERELKRLNQISAHCYSALAGMDVETEVSWRWADRVTALSPMVAALRQRVRVPRQRGTAGRIRERLTIPFRLQPALESAFRAASTEAPPGMFDIVRETYVPQERADFVIELRQRGDRLALTGRGFGDLSGKDLALVVTLTKQATRTVVLEARTRRRVVELHTTVASDGSFVAPLGHLRYGADPEGPMLEEVEVVAA